MTVRLGLPNGLRMGKFTPRDGESGAEKSPGPSMLSSMQSLDPPRWSAGRPGVNVPYQNAVYMHALAMAAIISVETFKIGSGLSSA